jgi:aldose 1-epimerase
MYGQNHDHNGASGGTATRTSQLQARSTQNPVVLANEHLRTSIVPALGGGLARFEWLGRRKAQPLLRPVIGNADVGNVSDLAAFLVVNYAEACGDCGSDDPQLAPAVELRGLPWEIEDATAHELKLVLNGTDRRLPFLARQTIRLMGVSLSICLEFANRGGNPIAMSTGICLSVIRAPGAHLSAPATLICANAHGTSSAQWWEAPLAWQMNVAYPLPSRRVRNLFSGWSGKACITLPEQSLELIVRSGHRSYFLDTPTGKDYFTFFPHDRLDLVNNANDALPDVGEVIVAPGERVTKRFSFTVQRT